MRRRVLVSMVKANRGQSLPVLIHELNHYEFYIFLAAALPMTEELARIFPSVL
jgi:hypothetical protein